MNKYKYEPIPEVLAVDEVLKPLGFSHGGDFYPIHFDPDDYKWIEIGCSMIAYTDTYVAILNFSLMEYWEHADLESPELAKLALAWAEKAVREIEGVED